VKRQSLPHFLYPLYRYAPQHQNNQRGSAHDQMKA